MVGGLLARSGFPVPDEGKRIGCIDGLRGYLALLVAVSHFVLWVRLLGLGLQWGKGPPVLATLGQGPVAIFFMITGLLFYPKVRDGFGKVYWRSLVVSRLFRIYPAALVAIFFIMIGLWIRADFPVDALTLTETGRNLVSWVLFASEPPLFGVQDSKLANAGVFWTLRAEWIFYLCVLPLFAILRSLTSRKLPRVLSPVLMIPLYFLFRLLLPGFAGFITHFMLGMILFELRERDKFAELFRRNDVAIAAAVLMLAAAIFMPTPTTGRTILFYAPFFACVACGHSYFGLFDSRGALVLGEASYGIYVLHGFILWAFAQLAEPWIANHSLLTALALPPVLALITLLAAFVNRAVEAPMINKGHAIARRLRRTSVAVSDRLQAR